MELLSLPYELDIRDYTRVLQSCNTFSLSSLVMQEVKRRGLTPDIMLYNVFLKKCEEFKNKDEAFETYKTMIDSNVTPDRHTMSILIRSCLAVDKPSEAESLLKRMLLHGIDLNSYVFNVVIDYYARKALPLEAFRIRENMATYSIKPDEYTISSLMAACYPVAPSKLYLQQLLQDLVQGPLPARAVCTNALFSGIAKAPHLENHTKLRIAVDFHSELERRSYTVGQHAYTSLMSCCAKVGDVAQARRFLGSMQRGGVEPNRYILTAFIAACSKAKAARKEQRDEEAAREAKRLEEVKRKDDQELQARAARLAAAADASGLTDDATLHISDYAAPMQVGRLRAWARGEFGDDSRYSGDLTARRISDPAKLAEELGCSTDYLLGVTDQLTPAATAVQPTVTALGTDSPWHWWPEHPQESGLYWCISGPLKSGGGLYWWNAEAEQWEHWGMSFRMTPEVVLWMRCPELPESMAWERQEVPDGEE